MEQSLLILLSFLCIFPDKLHFLFLGSENNSLFVYYKGLSKHLLTYKFDTLRNVMVRVLRYCLTSLLFSIIGISRLNYVQPFYILCLFYCNSNTSYNMRACTLGIILECIDLKFI